MVGHIPVLSGFNRIAVEADSFAGWLRTLPLKTGNSQVYLYNRDDSYKNFRTYLDTVFTYAGSYSPSRELQPVQRIDDIRIGDVFIQGGFPGHAILVVDLATSDSQTAIMLAQSYMPAQDIHILLNLAYSWKQPWYIVGATDKLYTPEWIFEWTDLKRFAEQE